MAATWIKSLHISKTMTKSSAVAAIIDYVENPHKTNGGGLITSYECDSRIADEQFLLAKREYEYIRQSFKSGEITPEQALELGYATALCFTKDNHAADIMLRRTAKKFFDVQG
jgi:hypothetical protein